VLPLIILIPLIVAIAAVAVSKGRHAKYIALLGSLASLALFPFIVGDAQSLGWISVGGVALNITTSAAPINSVLLLAVLLVAPAVFLYSFGFMGLPSEQRRFYLEMLAFEAAMLAFAMSGGFVMLFISWEFLSVISYLLIGFWNWRGGANRSARKAITVSLIGDLALLGAMAILFSAFGTLEFSGIISAANGAHVPVSAIVLLIIAILAKSVQFPFHEWLPDASEGPAPASAFLNSGATAKAGIFAAILLFPLFSASGYLAILFYAGAITVLLSTLNAATERRIDRVLAYSTVQGLGLMLIAIGSDALLAAVYFLFAQSFYSALLFLGAGASAKANGKEELDGIGGLKRNRVLYVTVLFGVLALAGFVPFSGFFASMGIASALGSNLAVYAFISLIGLATSFYVFRWFVLQNKKTEKAEAVINYKTVPRSMTYGLVLLAIGTLASGAAFFILPGFISAGGAAGAVSGVAALQANEYAALIETAFVAVGAALGYLLYRKKRKSAALKKQANLAGVLYTAGITNAIYSHLAEFVIVLGEGIDYFDNAVNSAFDFLGHSFVRSGNAAKRATAGEINAYVVIFAAGMLLLILALVIA
jgi:NADH-quinone oxidoreductase subunit L